MSDFDTKTETAGNLPDAVSGNAVGTEGKRTIETVTAEIKDLQKQASGVLTYFAVEIGRRLCEAKEMLPHGEWGEWLRDKVDFSQRTANNLMLIFKEYGGAQLSIFGAVTNSQALANLPYTKALQLLAIPEEEREDFAKEVRADEIPSRELDRLIREKKQIEEEREAARAEAEAKRTEAEDAQAALRDAEVRLESAKALLKDKTEEAEKLAKEQEQKVSERLAEEKKALSRSYKEKEEKVLKKAASEKEVAVAEEKERTRAELDAAKKSVEDAHTEVEKLRREAEEAKKAAEESRRAAEAAKRQTVMSKPEITEFKVLFTQVQKNLSRMAELLGSIEETDKDSADKLRQALAALGERLQK